MTASDISDATATFKLGDHPVESRQPFADDVVLVAGPEEPGDGAEHAGALIAPCHTTAVLESGLDFFKVGMDRCHTAERANHVDRLSSTAKTIACSGGNVNFLVAGS